MNNQPSWFARFFSTEFSESSKRLILIVLVFVYIVQYFLLMYIKVEIANKDLVKQNQWYLFWLILVFGGFVAADLIKQIMLRKAELQAEVDTTKAQTGTPDTTVKVQNVQSVTADNLTIKKDNLPDAG